MKDLPINVAEKKVINAIPKCPQAKPAKSKNGLGIEAKNNIVINPYFLSPVIINSFTSYDVY